MTEKNILAGFRTIENAQLAAQELQALGFSELQIDQVGKYPGNHLNDFVNPLTSRFDSLSDLTLGSFSDERAEILASSDVSASGMSDGGNGMEMNQNILLTLVTNESRFKEAENVIRKYGGEF